MSDNESAKERMRRIIALIEGAKTEHEAIAATLALQRVMESTGFTVEEVMEREKDAVHTSETARESKMEPWVRTLASVVSRNFRCEVLIVRHSSGTKKRFSLEFFGLPDDVVVARNTFIALRRAAGNCYRSWAAGLGERYRDIYTNRILTYHRNSYYLEFVSGVAHALDGQRQSSEETALALCVPAAVTSVMESRRTGSMRRGKLCYGEGDAYESGWSDGQSVVGGHNIGCP